MKVIKTLLFLIIPIISYAQKMNALELNGILFKFPEKFEYKGKNPDAGQHFFKTKKNMQTYTLSVRNKRNFEFYLDSLSNSEIIEKYFTWESDYWSDNSNGKIKTEVEKLKLNQENNLLFWKLRIIDKKFNDNKWTVFLVGVIEDKIVSMSLKDTKSESTDDQKIEFLKEIYLESEK